MQYTFTLNFSKEEIKMFPKNIKDIINQVINELMDPENMMNGPRITNQIKDDNLRLKIQNMPLTLKPQSKVTVEFTNPWLIPQLDVAIGNVVGHLKSTYFWTLDTVINYALGRMIREDNEKISIPFTVDDATDIGLALSDLQLDYEAGKNAGEF